MSIFDIVQEMLLDFVNNHLAFLILMIIAFNVIGFSFFNKR